MVSERCSGVAQSEITMVENNKKFDSAWEEKIESLVNRLKKLMDQKREESFIPPQENELSATAMPAAYTVEPYSYTGSAYAYGESSSNYGPYNEGYNNGGAADQSAHTLEQSYSRYWGSQYPRWTYEPSTGQWYQLDGNDAGESVQANVQSNASSTWGTADGQTEVSYLQKNRGDEMDRAHALYRESDGDRSSCVYGTSNGVLSRLGNRQHECLETELDVGRLSGVAGWGSNSAWEGYGSAPDSNFRNGGSYDDREFVDEGYPINNAAEIQIDVLGHGWNDEHLSVLMLPSDQKRIDTLGMSEAGNIDDSLMADKKLNKFDDQENPPAMEIDEEVEEACSYQLNGIGGKSATGEWVAAERELHGAAASVDISTHRSNAKKEGTSLKSVVIQKFPISKTTPMSMVSNAFVKGNNGELDDDKKFDEKGVSIFSEQEFLSKLHEFVVVHNGVITNYEVLKETIVRHGFTFESETDTEVIPKLTEFVIGNANEEGDKSPVTFSQVVLEVTRQLEGAYALAFESLAWDPHTEHPFVVSLESGMVFDPGGNQFPSYHRDPGGSLIVLRELRFRYLAAKCLEESKERDQYLLMFDDAKENEVGLVRMVFDPGGGRSPDHHLSILPNCRLMASKLEDKLGVRGRHCYE